MATIAEKINYFRTHFDAKIESDEKQIYAVIELEDKDFEEGEWTDEITAIQTNVWGNFPNLNFAQGDPFTGFNNETVYFIL